MVSLVSTSVAKLKENNVFLLIWANVAKRVKNSLFWLALGTLPKFDENYSVFFLVLGNLPYVDENSVCCRAWANVTQLVAKSLL